MAGSSSHVAGRWTYDVFVSFRGQEVRKNFIDHLFSDFKRKGIHAFKDDKFLKRGKQIAPELFRAIEQSRFLIVVFSKDYASSTWCLRELVKILECKEKEKGEYELRAIFYDVKPSVVRNQTRSYAAGLRKHEAANNEEVPKWKEALSTGSYLSGWDLQDLANGYQSKFIDIITKEIFNTLSRGPLDVGENLVGLHSRAEEMDLLQFLGSNKVHMIGICGPGGVGKTTIARAIYNLLHIHFEGSSFFEDVKGVSKREGIVHLQKQLLEDITGLGEVKIRSVGEGVSLIKRWLGCKKVLVVLDDVDHRNQVEALAGMPNWFGEGSLIVMTGRDRQLLKPFGVEEIYEVDYLHEHEALELFSLYAFRKERPHDDFIQLAYRVVQYVRGHPLALKVLGCSLFSKALHEWETTLDKLQRNPDAEVLGVLKISYDALDCYQKEVFLDIACFFTRERKYFVTKILDGCDLFPDTDIRVLVDKSLITIENDTLMMHELLQQMGWEIVREESEDPGRRSRLWFLDDVSNVLNNKRGTEAVRGLALDLSSTEVYIDCKTFENLINLRLLKLHYDEFRKRARDMSSTGYKQLMQEGCKLELSGGFEFLSNEIRWLHWHGYPLEYLPLAFYPHSLVSLDMSYSEIKQLWTGSKGLKRLAFLKLSHCLNLTRTPDFTEFPNLEELILDGCINLVEVDESIGVLKNLNILSMRNCRSIRNFPTVELKTLQSLILTGCSDVDKLLECFGETNISMEELHAEGTGANQLPSSSNIKLQVLRRTDETPSLLRAMQPPLASGLLPLSRLCSLRSLHLNQCKVSGGSLSGIGTLSLLEDLNLSGSNIISLPASFSQLSRMVKLVLIRCTKLKALPELPSHLHIIFASNCQSLEELPQWVLHEKSIKDGCGFDFSYCPKLAQNQTIESVVKLFLQEQIDSYKSGFSMVLSGSSIPAWFNIRDIGYDTGWLELDLPPQGDSRKIKAIAFCVVFNMKEEAFGPYITMNVSNSDDLCTVISDYWTFPGGSGDSDQTWLTYVDLSAKRWKANHHIEVSYEMIKQSPSSGEYVPFDPEDGAITMCGVRVIYEEDKVEENLHGKEQEKMEVEENSHKKAKKRWKKKKHAENKRKRRWK